MNCETCGKETEKRFCSKRCYPSRHKLQEVPCPKCGVIRLRVNPGIKYHNTLCKSCSSDLLSGPNSPTWKGGHKYWSPGRFGKDKNGLSWRVQRKLAWERDNYECQHCHEKKNRKPDVHHIEPWRISESHALDNLICLCQSCHLKEEAKVQEKWGGQLVTAIRKKETKNPKCELCHKKYALKSSDFHLCGSCKRNHLKTEAYKMSENGFSGCAIALHLGVTSQIVNLWLRKYNQ